MDFHLEFPLPHFPRKINYEQHLFFMGSCFAEEMAERLCRYKFSITSNPSGILYNPSSIALSLRRYISNDHLAIEDLFFANECWNSWEHHSRFSSPDQTDTLQKINREISAANLALKNSSWIFITLGSAFQYKKLADGKVVANCHKAAQKVFSKEMLSADAIINEYTQVINDLKSFNPGLNIVFTLSPVRYLRDGIVENSLSKAVLLQAVHALAANPGVYYFPSYELVMDDLRDYRFYKTDLVHPNEMALDYVFDKFAGVMLDDSSQQLLAEIKEIVKASEHRPFNENTEAHKKFLSSLSEKKERLKNKHPFLGF
jgi:hypothetical protein